MVQKSVYNRVKNRWAYWFYERKCMYVYIRHVLEIASLHSLITVDRQMLAIVLIWRVEKNRQIKAIPSFFPIHCKTYDFMKLLNFEQQIHQIKTSPSCPDCQFAN